MSTSNTSTESLHGTTVAESISFMDATLSNPLVLGTLRAQEILRLKLVCKAWAEWFAVLGTRAIATARRQDDSRDWYFPVFAITPIFGTLGQKSWSWSGIWHECADQAPHKVQSLPPLAHLPRRWTFLSNGTHNDSIVAGSCGLLLIRYLVAASSQSYWNRNWEPLLVCNPLTKEFRALPPPAEEVATNSKWPEFYRGVHAHMVVDDETNSYRIILTFRALVCVYTSTSNSWKPLRFPEPGPWGQHRINDTVWNPVCGSICSRGRLRFVDIELGPIDNCARIFRLRMFEIDFEAGEWTSHNRDIPDQVHRRRRHDKFVHWPLRDIQHGMIGFEYNLEHIILPALELVECMGEIYAVVPARLDEALEIGAGALEQTQPQYYELLRHLFNPEFEYMPLQFYIFQLEGACLVHGALRIQLPRSRSDLESRRESLCRIPLPNHLPFRHWFNSTASGSVIWVSFKDYLLQYDVMSGQSKTQIIPVNGIGNRMRFPYSPSFHMKP